MGSFYIIFLLRIDNSVFPTHFDVLLFTEIESFFFPEMEEEEIGTTMGGSRIS